jgi:SPP1 family predicted phage head-tail adaptor
VIRSGELRDRVTIQTNAAADDNPDESFTTTHKTRWPCKIVPISGQESYRGKQIEAGIDYVVEGRYLAGVTPLMRVYVTGGFYKAKYFNIVRVHQIQYQRGSVAETTLFCSERI